MFHDMVSKVNNEKPKANLNWEKTTTQQPVLDIFVFPV